LRIFYTDTVENARAAWTSASREFPRAPGEQDEMRGATFMLR